MMLMNMKFQGMVYILIFAVLGVLVLVKKPYLNNYNSYRFVANMIITVFILAIYVYYSILDVESKNKSPISFYLPLIVLALLLICVIYNAAFIIYHVVKYIKKLRSEMAYKD